MGVGGDGKLVGGEAGGGGEAKCRQQDEGGQRKPTEACVQGAQVGGVGEKLVGRTPWSAADALVGLGGSDRKKRVRGDPRGPGGPPHITQPSRDRRIGDGQQKSTRLNSSHLV